VSVRERLSKLGAFQRSLAFRIGASALVTIIAVAFLIVHVVATNAPPPPPAESAIAPVEGETPEMRTEREQVNAGLQASDRILSTIIERGADPTRVYITTALVWSVAVAAIWLGIGLTLVGMLAIAAIVIVPMYFFPVTRDYATFFTGIAILATALTTMLRVASLMLGGTWRPLAIARNVLTEAVRLKVSAIFIVILVFALAALPGLLDPQTPLRYRVQSLLQWGMGGTFFIISVLTVVFSVATVAFEQRDKIIWQTMTKPVRPWEYVLGKWLGVTMLAGVLLMVSATGLYLFTQYVRQQPALGESAAYVSGGDGTVSDDRRILETQVLSARLTRPADPPPIDEEQFTKNVNEKVEEEARRLTASGNQGAATFAAEQDKMREKIRTDLRKSVAIEYRTIDVGEARLFIFSGLKEAKKSNAPLILRYKINSGSDRPDVLYRITFVFPSAMGATVEEAGLGKFHYLELLPTVVNENGEVAMQVLNGDADTRRGNPMSFTFPPDGLEMSYVASTFEANFSRVVGVLWLKLAFLAMVGVLMATFTSFPVACLVTFVVYAAAEGATFLLGALDNYRTQTNEGQTLYFNMIVAFIATWVARAFKVYSELQPTSRLVDGRVLGWSDVARGIGVVALWIGALYAVAVAAFKRRELAIYSGNG